MRKKIIAGNWKMNMTVTETKALISKLKAGCNVEKCDVVFVVPSTSIVTAVNELKNTNIEVGAQNFYYEEKGAFTGEISADMILDAGAKYVIIGHSERRTIFKEDDLMINLKHRKAHEKGLIPILCCGESLELREANKYKEWIDRQIRSAFKDVKKTDAKNTIIAYEPIWAIGTGKTATSDEAEEVCALIRDIIGKLYDGETKDVIRIQYGGSVKSDNAKEILSKKDIDGGLVGGASLKEDFIKIVNYE